MKIIFQFTIYIIYISSLLSCEKNRNIEQAIQSPVVSKSDSVKNGTSEKRYSLSSVNGMKSNSYSCPGSVNKNSAPDLLIQNAVESGNFTDQISELRQVYEKMKKSSEVFSVNPRIDTVIVCKEGTRIQIPAFAFVYEDGTPVRDSIRFEVTEFFNKGDFLLANLSTSADGAMLETGGMLNVKAVSDGRKVKLKSNETVSIEVPTDFVLPDMELFYGNHDPHGKMNWTNESKAQKLKKKNRKRGKRRKITQEASLKELISYKDIKGNVCELRQIKHEWADSARKVEKVDSIEFSFSIDKKGIVTDGPIYKNDKLMKKDILTFFWDDLQGLGLRGYFRKSTRNLNFHTDYSIIVTGHTHSFEIYSDELKTIKKKIKESDGPLTVNVKHIYCKKDTLISNHYMKYRRSKELGAIYKDSIANKTFMTSYYAFEASQLDWINIDRFYKSKRPMVPFVVKTIDGKYVDVKVVFNNINSVLPGLNTLGKSDFRTLPEGEDVTVVAIMVDKGETYLAIKDTKITQGVLDGLEFNKVSSQELKEKMKSF